MSDITNTKLCISCGAVKSISEFWKQRKSFRSYCKDCSKKKWRDYYSANKKFRIQQIEKSKITAMARARDCQKLILEILENGHCIDCKEKDIVVLEFDHVRGEKKNTIANLINYGNLENLQKELEKCEIRCRNCHARKTAREINNYKYKRVKILNK